MYKAGIIGCGRIGVNWDYTMPECHAEAYMKCPDTELWSLLDKDPSRQEGARSRLNIRNEFQVDIVSICTPPDTHLKVLKEHLDVKGVLCEKPIATTLEDADEMIRLCQERNIKLQVNHQRRFVTPEFRFSRGILNTGTHMFDVLRMLLGDVELYGNKSKVMVKNPHGVNIEIKQIDTDKGVFELVFPHQYGILGAVSDLVFSIQSGKEPKSPGEEAREDLRLCLDLTEILSSQTMI